MRELRYIAFCCTIVPTVSFYTTVYPESIYQNVCMNILLNILVHLSKMSLYHTKTSNLITSHTVLILASHVMSILWGKLIVKIMQDLLQEVRFGAFVTKHLRSSCTMWMYFIFCFLACNRKSSQLFSIKDVLHIDLRFLGITRQVQLRCSDTPLKGSRQESAQIMW